MLEDMLERFINSVNVLNRQKGVMELDPYGCAFLTNISTILDISCRFIITRVYLDTKCYMVYYIINHRDISLSLFYHE